MNKDQIQNIVVRIGKFVLEVLLSWLLSLIILFLLFLPEAPDRIGGYTVQELIDRVVGFCLMLTFFIMPFYLPLPIVIELIRAYSKHKKKLFFSIVALQILVLCVGIVGKFVYQSSELAGLLGISVLSSGFTLSKIPKFLKYDS